MNNPFIAGIADTIAFPNPVKTDLSIHSKNNSVLINELPVFSPSSEADKQSYDPVKIFDAGLRQHHIANTAYPIAHQLTWQPYRIPNSALMTTLPDIWRNIQQLLLYAHIPFCERRCYYCEYTVVEANEKYRHNPYMESLLKEFDLYAGLANPAHQVLGFDIGGGTPSMVSAAWIDKLVLRAHKNFSFANDVKISIETTPSIAASSLAKLKSYLKSGIDRISMGVQVTQPDLLKILNRDADGLEHHRQAVANIRCAGFKEFNIDLMYGFAGQSLKGWEETLRHTIHLEPEFITLYRMRYKLTRISDQAKQVTLAQIGQMKQLAKDILGAAGYLAKPGKNTFSCISGNSGTSDYIRERVVQAIPYIGMGLGAQSFGMNAISYNKGAAGKNLNPYLKATNMEQLPVQDLYLLPRIQLQAKMIAVSFYFGEINLTAFNKRFGVTLESAYKAEIAFLLNRGYMHYKDDCLALTDAGAKVYNGIIALFYAPSVQAYLLSLE